MTPHADDLGCIPAAALSDVFDDRLRRWMPESVGVVHTVPISSHLIGGPPGVAVTTLFRGGGPRRPRRRPRPDQARRQSARPGRARTAGSGDSTRRNGTPPRRTPETHAESSAGRGARPAYGPARRTG